jgi:hypothetical protein
MWMTKLPANSVCESWRGDAKGHERNSESDSITHECETLVRRFILRT